SAPPLPPVLAHPHAHAAPGQPPLVLRLAHTAPIWSRQHTPAPTDLPPAAGHHPDRVDALRPLGDLDAFGEGLHGVVVLNRNGDLGDDDTALHAVVDKK